MEQFSLKPIYLLATLLIARMSLDFSAPYISLSFQNISISLSQAIGIGIAFLGIVLLIRYRQKLLQFPILPAFFVLGIWSIVSLFYSIAPRETAQDILRLFDLFIIGFFAFVSIRNPSDFRILLIAILASSILPILFGWYQFFSGIGFADENVAMARIFGTFSHPNIFALYLFALIAVGTTFFSSFTHNRREQILTAIWLSLSALTLLVTFTRVAWIAAFLFFVLVAAYRFRPFLIPLIFIPIVLFTFSDSFRDRIEEIIYPTPDSSIVWRQELWYDNIRQSEIYGRQWFGTGLETFPKASEHLRGIRFGSNEAHNDFVKFYIEGGRIGLLIFAAYLAIIASVIIHGYRCATNSKLKHAFVFVGFFFFAILVASLSDNIFKNTPLWWIFFATLGGLLGITKSRTVL